MKKLSSKEKVKRYDELIAMAKKHITHVYDETVSKFILDMFPELEEGEDEITRKDIINLIYKAHLCKFITYVERDKMIAWFEKQGESDETKAKVFLMNKGYPIDTNGVFPTYEELYNIIREGLEQQSEQNHADKVEPKFKVGDWIVFNGLTLYINDVVKGYYRTISIDGIPNSYDWDIDNAARLWTIKDATDGDVLCLGGVIAIFKKYIGQENCICYCSSCDKGGFEIPIENGEDNVYGCTDTTPANKEQRDLLFAKMHEAGYEWDKDKKELIKQMTDEEHKQYMLVHQVDTIYDMSFEEAQDYISQRGFDIPWNDGDVMVDERCITQTVANVLKWADRHPLILLDNKQEEYASGLIYHPK